MVMLNSVMRGNESDAVNSDSMMNDYSFQRAERRFRELKFSDFMKKISTDILKKERTASEDVYFHSLDAAEYALKAARCYGLDGGVMYFAGFAQDIGASVMMTKGGSLKRHKKEGIWWHESIEDCVTISIDMLGKFKINNEIISLIRDSCCHKGRKISTGLSIESKILALSHCSLMEDSLMGGKYSNNASRILQAKKEFPSLNHEIGKLEAAGFYDMKHLYN